jgi:hypothetical protein
MRYGLGRLAWAATLALATLATVEAVAATELAKPGAMTGTTVLIRAGQSSNVAADTQFREGDIIRVPENGRMVVEFGDGASLSLVGQPTYLRFGPMDPTKGRRLVLGSGVISEATVLGIAVEIQAPTPYDASIVLQNARAFVRVNPQDRVVFQKLEGNYAKAWRADKPVDLSAQAWILNVRDNTVSYPGAPGGAAGAAGEVRLGDAVRIMVGPRTITYSPAANFKRENSADGGVRLTYRGGDFGVVTVGRDTNLFLADGQSVTFDGGGNVTSFEGISHVYHPLNSVRTYDQPVENASEASPSNPNNR